MVHQGILGVSSQHFHALSGDKDVYLGHGLGLTFRGLDPIHGLLRLPHACAGRRVALRQQLGGAQVFRPEEDSVHELLLSTGTWNLGDGRARSQGLLALGTHGWISMCHQGCCL